MDAAGSYGFNGSGSGLLVVDGEKIYVIDLDYGPGYVEIQPAPWGRWAYFTVEIPESGALYNVKIVDLTGGLYDAVLLNVSGACFMAIDLESASASGYLPYGSSVIVVVHAPGAMKIFSWLSTPTDTGDITIYLTPITNVTLTAGNVTAWYNDTERRLHVLAYGVKPPARVRVYKHFENGTSKLIIDETCTEETCEWVVTIPDPFLEVVYEDQAIYRRLWTGMTQVGNATSWERKLIERVAGGAASELGVDVYTLLAMASALAMVLTFGVVGYLEIGCLAGVAAIWLVKSRYGVQAYDWAVITTLIVVAALYALAKRR